MKILHINGYAIRGGCEKACHTLICSTLDHEHEVMVLGEPGPMSADWEILNTNVRHLNILNQSLFSFQRALKSALTKDYDLIIYWSNIRLAIVLNAVKGSTRSIKIYMGNPCPYSKMQLLKESLLSFLYPPISLVQLLACSEYVATSFRDRLFFKNFQITASLNPVFIPNVNPKLNGFSKTLNKIGMVARLDPIKNHSLLFHAFKRVLEKKPLVELHLAGNGILMDELVLLSNSLGINDNVVFHGDVEDVYAFLSHLDLFVYATTNKEGLGVSVVEAIANGLPCVLPDLPMLRELENEGDSLIWYNSNDHLELANKILEVLAKPERLETISNSNYQNAKRNFSPEKFVKSYLEN